MRWPAAGAGAGYVDVGAIGRRRRSVRDDGGRAVVAPAEGDAGDVELRGAMAREVLSGTAPRRFAGARFLLDLGRRLHAQGIGEALRIGGVAQGERPALGLVALEQARRRLAADHRRELPAEIHRILHSRVVAQPARRGEEMRGIAADERTL